MVWPYELALLANTSTGLRRQSELLPRRNKNADKSSDFARCRYYTDLRLTAPGVSFTIIELLIYLLTTHTVAINFNWMKTHN